jgi:hypothetical protein
VNAVGYVNTSLAKGFNLISNPLDNKATGGNQIKSLFGSLPGGTQVYLFNSTLGKFEQAQVDDFTGEFTGPASVTDHELKPGEGVFVRVDAPTTLTFVGEVPAGQLSNPLPKGFSVRSSQVPQQGTVEALGFTPDEGDQIYIYNNATGKYGIYTYTFGAWEGTGLAAGAPATPTLDVGQAAFFRTDVAKTWSRNFVINQ